MSILQAKAIAACSFLGISIIGTAIGFFFQNNRKVKSIIPVANGFAGGALLSLWVFHILPEQSSEINQVHFGFYAGNFFYNISYFVIFGGFYLMLIFSMISPTVSVEYDKNFQNSEGVSTQTFNISLDNQQLTGSKIEELEPVAVIELGSEEPKTMKTGMISSKKKLRNFFTPTTAPITFAFFGLGLAIHSFFEGFAAGKNDSPNAILISTGGLMVHKWIETLLLVLNYPRNSDKNILFWSVIAIASLGSPIGLFTDFLLSGAPAVVILIFSSLSTGILLFVVFHIISEMIHETAMKSIYSLISFLCGSIIVLALFVTSSHLEAKE